MPEQAPEPETSNAEPSREDSPVYTISGLANELRQGEIINHVAQYTYSPVTGRAEELYQNYVIVASQDCDLLWDYQAVKQGKHGDINGLLVYEAEDASSARSRLTGSGKADIWRRLIQNREERYHYLESVPPELDLIGQGLPPLIVDFKRCFTIQPAELYRQCDLGHGARRRCRLEPLYREHFQSRAAFYIQRVGLPLAHRKPTDVTSQNQR